jgi:hypothetical protein
MIRPAAQSSPATLCRNAVAMNIRSRRACASVRHLLLGGERGEELEFDDLGLDDSVADERQRLQSAFDPFAGAVLKADNERVESE